MSPLVYRVFDKTGRLIYLGATSNLDQRLDAHRTQAWWFSLLDRVETEPHPTMTEAFAAERTAIHAEKPAFNLHGGGGQAGARRRLTDADVALCSAWNGYLPVALRWTAVAA